MADTEKLDEKPVDVPGPPSYNRAPWPPGALCWDWAPPLEIGQVSYRGASGPQIPPEGRFRGGYRAQGPFQPK